MVDSKKKHGTSTSEDHGESSFHDLENGASDTSTQNCCIYSVPKTLVEVSGKKWFEPRVVSIGHYNCKNDAKHKRLQMKQKHKQEFCSILQSRVKTSMEELMEIIRRPVLEAADARSAHYSQKIKLNSATIDPFLRMLVLDGCFILELFRVLGKSKKIESDHPLASVAWAIPQFYGDLLLLENQIPFVVLKKLFETSKMPDEDYPLSLLALRFFNNVMRRSEEDLQEMSEKVVINDSLHLLNLVRLSFITRDLDKPPATVKKTETAPAIYCITKLLKAGIKIKLREEADNFLAVKFNEDNGVIEMPKITLEYFMHSFLVNCRAFEQLDNKSSKHITVYAYFLDCLVNTAKDAEYLSEHNIIDSYVGKNSEVVQFINKLGKEMDVETDQFYLYDFFRNVDDRYNKRQDGKMAKKGEKTKKSSTSEDHGESSFHDLEKGRASDTSTQNCCIYSVPKALVEISGKKWFEPRVVSIGHYNCKNDAKHKRLQVIQKHKQEFCSILQSRVKTSMEELMEIIRRPVLEAADARSAHYSQKIKLNSTTIDPFLRMLVLDGCFILELFRVLGKSKKIESDHPLASVAWAIPQFYGDLLLLENQIPFVVLKKLFETSKMPDEDYPLSLLALRFFNNVMRRSDEDVKEMSEKVVINDSLHLLNLVRLSFITHDLDKPPGEKKTEPVPVIYCITKLLKAGIKIKLREPAADSFLAVKFKNGVIEMPKIAVDYFMHSFVVNCRAFEQLDNESSKHITVYAYFLDCLVNTAKDAEYLYEHNIIDSYVGKNSEVVQFINKLGKEMDVETDQFYLYDFFRKVDDRYNNPWKKRWTEFKHRYFNTPWSFISALAALVLLVLTILQTYYTMYAYYHPK
ncbi:hypothetical protein F2P56_037163 [Juglans regia]|uniref:Uncharacterized protein LOC109019298 n=2 Tax=Juglans regia TaxID=51240 RepID=A0A2I4HLU7_JUGRE|nr:uncharacterized protein LOC109019298 [Juglans regia]KAF5441884.1 hypothetical protein F2P56_037163 [Juglans regia]